MSHFTVLVIGPDPEAQLAPYHEFECTGVDDQYVIDVDITEEVKEQIASARAEGQSDAEALQDGLEYHGLIDERVVEDETEVERDGAHKYGFAVVRDGELIKAVNRTNPNKKWDWHELGGRWTGFFALKMGGAGVSGRPGLMTKANIDPTRADAALKRDIDFDAMRDMAELKARARYAHFHEVIKGCPFPGTFKDFVTLVNEDYDQARKMYWAQPAMQALLAVPGEFPGRAEPEDYAVTADEYARRARAKACSTFAVVKDGKWYERGSMGWWGCVSDEMDDDEWLTEFNRAIDDTPDDTLFSIFDCHI